MLYKVFLVEDEIVTREGIRDNVDWEAYGFEFCGEAPDGEMALPLLQMARPDVLITDIKMPFMDGLQLCKIVRERMPHTKIIILSGHDEFEYAQEAISLGVMEYLLKPVGVQDLHNVLQKIAIQLQQEKSYKSYATRLKITGSFLARGSCLSW
jgi:two-component system response regulator YesN